jgi:hypothetical protein
MRRSGLEAERRIYAAAASIANFHTRSKGHAAPLGLRRDYFGS